MIYETYKNREHEVEAALFEDVEDIGEIVMNLYYVGCNNISVVNTPNNPQLEDTSYTTSIAFTQNGVVQVLFFGDILSFDEDDNAVVWNEEDFLNEFELIGE